MFVRQIMHSPIAVTPDTPVKTVSSMMKKLDVGMLPVCENCRPVGIVTDRDIVIRCVPNAVDDCLVGTIMSPRIHTCYDDQTVEQVAAIMGDSQIRRLVVLDRNDRMVGIVTLGDIANDASEEIAGQTLGEIVERR